MMILGAKALRIGAALFVSLGFGVDANSQSPAPLDAASTSTTQTRTDGKVNAQASKLKTKPDAGNNPPASAEDYDNTLGKPLLRHFVFDQKAIWTSPAHVRFSDAAWLAPLGGFTAALLVSDRDFSKHLSNSPPTLSNYKKFSDYGIGAMVAAGGGMYLWGKMTSNDHARETGLLAGEAAIDSLMATYTVKYATRRERPQQGNGNGNFWSGGDSFPSEHASAAWSIASVVAHEYPGFLTQLFAYGGATAISISRIKAKQHFPSDVLVGSVLGNLIAQNIYRRHHDPEVGGGEWRSISEIARGDGSSSTANLASPYVSTDSWIYPALDRLAALDLIDSGFAGMRPWTRNECARLLDEATERIDEEGRGGPEAGKIYRLLQAEFRDELEGRSSTGLLHGRIESVYTRVTGISGEPITDGNHFGQTVINDFGRPYQKGFNSVDGISAWTTSGRWVGYVRAEYQHSVSAPALPDSARQFIASADNLPGTPPATPFAQANRVRLLDAYVGLQFDDWLVSFGKQSLWWGPSESGPLMLSDNAEPVNMIRMSRVSPFKLPSVLGWLGPIRVEWFLGQLTGHEFVFQTDTGIVGQFGRSLSRQPFLQGQKISLKPSVNFEFSVSVTTVFAGGPGALNWHTFLRTYSLGNSLQGGGPSDPGDRRSGVDFSYRIPGLRNWLTFYGEALAEDEFSPLAYPRKSAIAAGIYMPRVPGIPKLDLRLEGGTTVPPDFPGCNGCVYVNGRYPDGSYVNQGNLAGSWMGRGGVGEQAWSTYWLTSRNKIQLNYRHLKVSGQYLPQGGTMSDGGVKADYWLNSRVELSGSVQYERWKYPVLDPLAKSNLATSVELSFWPRSWK
jgi:membrane-associated phospholipid phosphatase